ncbi:MAG: hypothetical protein II067_08790, partial [Agathobacter sp.]|uniref:hypothetical protein n=1 Tax=Agathobacter sp. TaxID=2021311 RepID=UPI00257EC576
IKSGQEQKERYEQCLNWGYDAIFAVPVQRIKIMDTHIITTNIKKPGFSKVLATPLLLLLQFLRLSPLTVPKRL